jgi:hypothetical protein
VVAQSVQCLTTEWTTGVRSPAEAADFSSSLCVQTGSGAHPASCPVGTDGPFPGDRARPGRDTDHSPPYSAEVKNKLGAILPLSASAFMACGGTALGSASCFLRPPDCVLVMITIAFSNITSSSGKN